MSRAFPRPPRTSGGIGRPGNVGASRLQVVLGLFLLLGSARLEASSFIDPALHFRTVATEHFLIHFHQGEEHLAARLVRIAEDVWPVVGRTLGVEAPKRTHVILADQTEIANGWATPVPYNTIFIPAAAPAGSEFIGNERDWLRLVFIHEFTHIVHLNRSEGWARVFRHVLGRSPVTFPNLTLPPWQIEGLATWMESRVTGEGRLHAGDFRAIEKEAASTSGIEPLDRVNGGLIDWPGGLAPYAFGLGFHDYLAERFGDESFARLVDETSHRLPFLGTRAYSTVYGEPLGVLWRDYQAASRDKTASNPRPDIPAEARQLTRQGFYVAGPRFVSGRCPGCPDEVVYAAQSPHEFPALYSVALTWGHPSLPRALTSRYLGHTTAVSRNYLVFDQLELRENVNSFSDLYVWDRRSGQTHALTRNARIQDPDLSPDGQWIAAVRENRGTRDLVLVRLATPIDSAAAPADVQVSDIVPLVSETDTQFNAPRWSPDGGTIAVARQRLGALSEVVTVDVVTRDVRVIASSPGARFVTPTWRPDGRAVIAAAAIDGDVFNLYELSVSEAPAPVRQLTTTAGGALWPDVSADGRLLVYAGYTPAGFDIFVVPYPESPTSTDSGWTATSSGLSLTVPAPRQPPPVDDQAVLHDSRAYGPGSTLLPTSWFPLIEDDGLAVRVGAAATGTDILRRHAYYASATWLARAPARFEARDRTTPDWQLAYTYDRWRPAFFVSASSDTLLAAGPPDANGHPTDDTIREREFEAGILWPVRHVRVSHRALVSLVRTSDNGLDVSSAREGDRTAVRVGAATDSSHVFGYAISQERGIAAGTTAEFVRRALGSSTDVTTITGDLRAYLPMPGEHHVLALRLAGGASSGPDGARRAFLLGGPGSSGDVMSFGRTAFSLLRGFAGSSFAGTHIATANIDYRWPLARPQRGIGTWPIFLRTLHAATFADAGHAWTDGFDAGSIKTALGGELAADIVAGYSFPFTTAVGAAWGYDGAHRQRNLALYLRVGRAF